MRAIQGLLVEVRGWLLLCIHRAATGDENGWLSIPIGSPTRKLCGPDDLGAAKCLDETGQQTALFATAGKPAPKAAPKQPQCTDAMGCTDNGCNCQNGGHCDQTHCRNVKQVACNQGGCNQAGVSAKDSVYCSGGCNQKGATALSGIVLCSRHNWGDTCLY